MLEPSKTNKYLKTFAYIFLFISIIAALVILFTMKYHEPDEVLPITGSVIPGDEIPHPARWWVALGVLGGGILNALFFFAISEVLTRLQAIQYNTEKANEYNEKVKASS